MERNHIRRVFEELLKKDLNEHQLWSVITALRGPDDQNDDVKEAVTSVIRHAVGFRNLQQPYFMVNADSVRLSLMRQKIMDNRFDNKYSGYHFFEHAQNAFFALGLKWGDVNDLPL